VIVFFIPITIYLGLIGFIDFSMTRLINDGLIDCKYWTEKGMWRNCVGFDSIFNSILDNFVI